MLKLNELSVREGGFGGNIPLPVDNGASKAGKIDVGGATATSSRSDRGG